MTECGEGLVTWNWTRMKLGMVLRVNPNNIPKNWTIRPTFTFWPPQRHAAILWILANLVLYRLQTHRRLSLSDFMDFLRRSRWKSRPRAATVSPTGRGTVPGGTRVNAPMDFNLKQKAMPGRISPQPAAPQHGPPEDVYLLSISR